MKTGDFVWYDLMTTDVEAAKAFYGAVVGWRAEPSGMGEYTLLFAGDKMVAGLMPMEAEMQGMPPCWTGYIQVDDVDAYVARVTEAGGALKKPAQDIPTVGRFAVVADPHGAGFLIFAPSDTGNAAAAPMTPGHVGWHELHAGDREADFAFYQGLFGWQKKGEMDMGPMGTYLLWGTDGDAIGGIMTRMPNMPASAWLYYFVVADIDTAAATVAAQGGTVLNGPVEVPGGAWIIQGRDPQGAMFALVGMRAA